MQKNNGIISFLFFLSSIFLALLTIRCQILCRVDEILFKFKFYINPILISSDLYYLSDLGGKNVLSLFNQDLINNYIFKSPVNPVNGHHLIFITLATSDYLDNMKICLQSALNHGLLVSELIVMSLDSDVYEYFQKQNIQTIFLNYGTILQKTWFNVGRLKQAIQYYFNCFGVDTLFFESDMIFCRNFKDELIETLNDNVDIQIMEEVHHPRKQVDLSPPYFGYNIGLMLVKSSNNTRKLFKRWLHDCYFTKDNLWDQSMFNFIVTNTGRVYDRDWDKQYLYYRFTLEKSVFDLKFHFLNPVKYINYCSLILDSANHFNSTKIDTVLNYAKEMNLANPNLLHFACINGKNKFTYMKNISLKEESYLYHMNYLKNFNFVP